MTTANADPVTLGERLREQSFRMLRLIRVAYKGSAEHGGFLGNTEMNPNPFIVLDEFSASVRDAADALSSALTREQVEQRLTNEAMREFTEKMARTIGYSRTMGYSNSEGQCNCIACERQRLESRAYLLAVLFSSTAGRNT